MVSFLLTTATEAPATLPALMGALTIASIFAGMFSWPKAWMHSKSRQKAVPKTKQYRFMIYPFLYQRASSSIANRSEERRVGKECRYRSSAKNIGIETGK